MVVFVLIQLYVVVPVVLALFLAAVLEPPVARLRRRGWPAALATAVVFLATLAVLALLIAWILRLYLVATALTGLIDGVLIAVALLILGVPLVLPLAVLTFLGGFFPLVGATFAGLVAVGAGLLVAGLLGAFLSVPLVAIAAQTANYLRTKDLPEEAAAAPPPPDHALSGSPASGSTP